MACTYLDANLRGSNGNLYSKLNFKLIHHTTPSYFYIYKSYNLYNRLKFQKHKIKKYYEEMTHNIKSYDSNLTELENMISNDYRIIYDVGQLVFSKSY